MRIYIYIPKVDIQIDRKSLEAATIPAFKILGKLSVNKCPTLVTLPHLTTKSV